jgi:hypothetical protein
LSNGDGTRAELPLRHKTPFAISIVYLGIVGSESLGRQRMPLTRRAVTIAIILLQIREAEPAPLVELHVATAGDELRFVPYRLGCTSGRKVRLFLHHMGELINDVHDWVLLKPGTKNIFVRDADREPDESLIVPPGDENLVLAATPLCGRGQTVIVEFSRPANTRSYVRSRVMGQR